jgi:hypothetical protein
MRSILLSSLAVLTVFAAISSNPASAARPPCCASADKINGGNLNVANPHYSVATPSTSGGVAGRVITNGKLAH